jgi:hypothetical protein
MIGGMKRAIHTTTLVLAWGFVVALVFTIIRELKGDTYFVPEGYFSGYLAFAIFFALASYKTRSLRVKPPGPPPEPPADSN